MGADCLQPFQVGSLRFLTAWWPQCNLTFVWQHIAIHSPTVNVPRDRQWNMSELGAGARYMVQPYFCHILSVKGEPSQGSLTLMRRRPRPSPLPGRRIKEFESLIPSRQTVFHCYKPPPLTPSACANCLLTGICFALCRIGITLCLFCS